MSFTGMIAAVVAMGAAAPAVDADPTGRLLSDVCSPFTQDQVDFLRKLTIPLSDERMLSVRNAIDVLEATETGRGLVASAEATGVSYGLVPPAEDGTTGYYLAEVNTVFLLEGRTVSPATVAHELTHARQRASGTAFHLTGSEVGSMNKDSYLDVMYRAEAEAWATEAQVVSEMAGGDDARFADAVALMDEGAGFLAEIAYGIRDFPATMAIEVVAETALAHMPALYEDLEGSKWERRSACVARQAN